MLALIHYGEIGLKGGNRKYFENKLVSNVHKALGENCKGVKMAQARIIAETKGKISAEKVASILSKVYGVEWFAIAQDCEPDIDAIWAVLKGELGRIKGKKFRVETKRGDKSFKMDSMEVSKEIGARIVEATKAPVDLSNPEITVFIEIMRGKALVHFGKIRGLRGLPVGTSGKVLCLMSGGIDSPVAACMMMKRGCEVDYLHIHPFEQNKKVKGTKIDKLVKMLDAYQQREGKLLLVPYAGFYARTGKVESRYELVVFRKYLYSLAERIALEQGYLGIVSGDSLGQVASQTIENIGASSSGLQVPVFRPLISMDKMEIVEAAQKIGTYEESIKQYQDCCSLVAVKNPATKAKREIIDKYYEEMEIEKLIKESLKEMGEL
jgi:thiamine biosynthesis protein ThiI